MSTLHQRRTHPEPIPGCFGCKVGTVALNNSAAVKDIDRREKVLGDDLRAYRDFRRSGLQPEHLKGSAELERTARSPLEVEHSALINLPADARAHAGEAAQLAGAIPDMLKAAQ